MLKINLLKNNIPNKIDIPKKPKSHFVKFLFIAIFAVLVLGLAVFGGFYFAKKQTLVQTAKVEKPVESHTAPDKSKKITKSNNNAFNIVVTLQNATANNKTLVSRIKETPVNPKTAVELEQKNEASKQQRITTSIATAQRFEQKKEASKPIIAMQNNIVTKPAKKTENAKENCIVFCNADQLDELKTALEQKHIEYSVKKNISPQYHYIVYVGGLNKSGYLEFKNALKSKGYNVVGTKFFNGKYYADLGKMSATDKDKFITAWKNLGFDILVDKQKEMSIKDYEVNFACSRDVFEEFKQEGFRIKAGRGAAW
ncbi:hypothetical protein [Desulfurella sp.]|uniref:hypothetical protein n=1 Tax=Desulfurella sp. TaxID=1962857 RepID=UPI0025BF6974|nr:hypothetical protein [Desulfurella sp.]